MRKPTDVIRLRFIAKAPPYLVGERAGKPAKIAANLVERRLAVYVDADGNEIDPPPEPEDASPDEPGDEAAGAGEQNPAAASPEPEAGADPASAPAEPAAPGTDDADGDTPEPGEPTPGGETPADGAPASSPSVLDGSVPEVAQHIEGLSTVEELQALAEAEADRERPRQGVLVAIEERLAALADADE